MTKRISSIMLILCMVLTLLQGIVPAADASSASDEWTVVFSDDFQGSNGARPAVGGATYTGADKWSVINHDATYDTICVAESDNIVAKLHLLDNSTMSYPNMRKCVNISRGKTKIEFKFKCDSGIGILPNIILRSQSGTQVPLITSTSDGKLRFGYGSGLAPFGNEWQTVHLEYTASTRALDFYLTNSTYTNKQFGPYTVPIPEGFDLTNPLIVFQMAIPAGVALDKACGYFDDVKISSLSTSADEIVNMTVTSLLVGNSDVIPQEQFATSKVITRAGDAEALLRISNSIGTEITPVLITAIYDANTCVSVNFSNIETVATGTSKDTTVKFNIPEGITNGTLKFLLWDSLSGMNSYLAPVITSISTQRALSLPNIFRDGMVLQRDKTVRVFGEASENAQITVNFGGETAIATATEGRFIAEFNDTFPANTTPQSLVVESSTGESITINDVLVGDVLVGGGQSNMAMTFDSNLQKIPHPDIIPPNMRWFKLNSGAGVSDAGMRYDPANNNYSNKEKWQTVNTNNVGEVSAVMYFAAEKMLSLDPDVPVGIIVDAWGGTVIQQWISPDTLENGSDTAYNGWRTEYSNRTNIISSIPYSPISGLYHYQTATIMPYTVKAFVWYQGESNSQVSFNYHLIFKDMIEDYREKWQDSELPVFVIQLPGWLDDKWSSFRLKQAWLEENMDDTYLIVTNDTGDDRTPEEIEAAGFNLGQHTSVTVHPADKQPIGDRLARSIAANLDGKTIAYAGPKYTGMSGAGQTSVTLSFTNINDGLISLADDNSLPGFEVSEDGLIWTSAEAAIVNNQVILTAKTAISYVRYGYVSGVLKSLGSVAEEGNAEFPAAPFRTDGQF